MIPELFHIVICMYYEFNVIDDFWLHYDVTGQANVAGIEASVRDCAHVYLFTS